MTAKEFTDTYYIDRKGTGCCKWDDLERQFGHPDMIAMWVADMDFQAPKAVMQALVQRAQHGVFGYCVPQPSAYLEAFCDWEQRRHQVTLSNGWIRYSPGIVSAIHWCIQAFTRKNDSIIINTPVYYPFARAVRNLHRSLVCNELVNTGGTYTVDMNAFEAQIREHSVKMFILCSPHNPVGRVWKKEELETLFAICAKHDVLILSDEIHQDFVYEGHCHTSAFRVGEGKYTDRLVLLTSASKTFNLAGLKNAFVVIPSDGMRSRYDEFCRSVSDNDGCLFGYTAVEAAYRHGEDWLTDLKNVILENYEYAARRFREALPEAVITPLEGTYLMWVDLKAYVTPENIEEIIRHRALVAVDFGSWFSDTCPTFIRLNLATSMENVKLALDAILREIHISLEINASPEIHISRQ